MSLPDEEQIEKSLRRYRATVPAPREEWVRYGEEMLARQARKMKRTERITRVMTYSLGTSAAILIGVWVQGAVTEKANLPSTADHGQREESAYAASAPVQVPGIFRSPVVPPYSTNGELSSDGEKSLVLPQTANEQGTGHKLGIEEAGETEEAGEARAQRERTVHSEEQSAERSAAVTGDGLSAADQKSVSTSGLQRQAERYLQEKLGQESRQYRFNPARSRLAEGIVAFSRVVEGIPAEESSLVVKIDKGSEVVGMEIYPSEQHSFSSGSAQKPMIDQAEAAQKLATTLRLVYAKGEKPVLRYQPLQISYVDALSGKVAAHGSQAAETIRVQPEAKPLRALDVDSASGLLRDEFGVKIKNGSKPVRMINGSTFEYLWEWDGGKSARIRMDKKGNVLSFTTRNAAAKAGNQEIGVEEARRIAIERLARYLPAGVEEIEMISQVQDGQQTLYRFSWVHQGIPVINHSFDVYVDRTSGTIAGMAGPFGEALPQLPNAKDVISLEEAMKVFAEKVKPELAYRTNDQGKTDTGMQLVYPYPMRNEKPLAIDAKTGTLIQP